MRAAAVAAVLALAVVPVERANGSPVWRPAPTCAVNADTTDAVASVAFYLRNNQGWFRNVSIVTYPPQRSVPSITVRTFFPFQRIRFRVPPGAQIFLADGEEIRFLREGGDLRSLRDPLVTAAPAIEGRAVDMF